MLNFIKKLFGVNTTVEAKPDTSCCSENNVPKTLEFHEEIRQQVEAEKDKAPAKKPAAKKPAAKKAPVKATAKKAPAKKTAPKKSK